MQTRLPVGGDAGRSLVVPFLAYDGRAQRISWALGHGPWEPVVQPLHVLLPQQRLVGYAGDAGMGIVAAKFFPETICLPLDGVDPLAGSAAAWDTLDALVIDQAVAARLSEERRLSPLLAAGIQIVVRTPQRPDTIWPWLQVGDCWVADPNASSPPAVYDSRSTTWWPVGKRVGPRIFVASWLFSPSFFPSAPWPGALEAALLSGSALFHDGPDDGRPRILVAFSGPH